MLCGSCAHDNPKEASFCTRCGGRLEIPCTHCGQLRALLAPVRVLRLSEGASARRNIEVSLQRTQSLIEETGATSFAPFVHEECARLAHLLDDEATYRRELGTAHRLFLEIGASLRAEPVAKELAS